MFGLGLDLTVDDFRDVWRRPRAALIVLALQLVVLPVICFGLIELFQLEPLLAVGMMLVAASPGGVMASVFSHLFRGDVALNVSVTVINMIISIVTWPLVVELAIDYYGVGGELSVPIGEVLKILLVVLVPVTIGMVINARESAWAMHRERPLRWATLIAVVLLVIGALVEQRENVIGYIADVGLIVLVYASINFVIGFFVPLLLAVGRRRALSCSMELGVHQTTLSILLASEVLDNERVAVPAGIYGLFMLILAGLWGFVIREKKDGYVGRRRAEV